MDRDPVLFRVPWCEHDMIAATNTPLVSVVVPTYQHAAFIGQCLDGILMQQVSFPIEVLVGEDESSDGTREICQRYAAEHPERIRLCLRSRKDVMHIMGRPTGRANLLFLLGQARGKYIALCEGDDYWTDPLKLQKQVDAMEADPAAVGCFTDAWNEKDGMRTSYLNGTYANKPESTIVGQREMVLRQNIPTCTFVFRRDRLYPLPAAISYAPVGDTVLYVHLTRNGHLRYLPVHTSVRTMHAGGAHSLRAKLFKIEVRWQLLPILDGMTNGRYSADVQRKMTKVALAGWAEALKVGDRTAMRRWWKTVSGRRDSGWGRTTTWRNWMKVHVPLLERLYGKLRGA